MEERVVNKWTFLRDVFVCSLMSYGGPEAHYGIFSSVLVEKKKYLSEEELTELIGLHALVPGPSSTQTITAIGYYVGGPLLAIMTFLVWALPAIVIMSLLGVFFVFVKDNESWLPVIKYLPAVAVGFIVYAAVNLSRKVLKKRNDWLLYIVMLGLGLLLVRLTMWFVPIMLIAGGVVFLLPHLKSQEKVAFNIKPKWLILGGVVLLAGLNEVLRYFFHTPTIVLYSSFYRYGYSVIGGGQIVIPLMIQDLVQTQSLISLSDFLSGYAIDQAIPGPLFSFAAFVSARSFAGKGYGFLAGLLGGLSIFLPGIMLVFFIFPIWKKVRRIEIMRYFLSGVTVTAASLIMMTAITQSLELPVDLSVYLVVIVSSVLLLSKKVSAPLIVIIAAAIGFII